jgi:UDP-N-acetylmuramoylalanine--D-glutamate ligase
MEQVGRRGNVLFVNDSKATNADAAAKALAVLRASTGSPAACPRRAASSLAPYFPRIAKAYLIGEAAKAFAATLGEACRYEISARWSGGGACGADAADGWRRGRGAAVAGLRELRPVQEFRGPRRRLPAPCGALEV